MVYSKSYVLRGAADIGMLGQVSDASLTMAVHP